MSKNSEISKGGNDKLTQSCSNICPNWQVYKPSLFCDWCERKCVSVMINATLSVVFLGGQSDGMCYHNRSFLFCFGLLFSEVPVILFCVILCENLFMIVQCCYVCQLHSTQNLAFRTCLSKRETIDIFLDCKNFDVGCF